MVHRGVTNGLLKGVEAFLAEEQRFNEDMVHGIAQGVTTWHGLVYIYFIYTGRINGMYTRAINLP